MSNENFFSEDENIINFDSHGLKGTINMQASLYFIRATNFYKENKVLEAYNEMLNCTLISPNHKNYLFYLGYIAEDIPDYNAAIKAYVTSLEVNPLQNHIHYRLGLCYQFSKKFEESIDSFSKSLNNFEEYVDPIFGFSLKLEQVYHNRSISYANIGNAAKVFEDCNLAISINPEYGSAYFIRGMEYLKCDKLVEAEIDLRKASALNFKRADSVLEQYFPLKKSLYEEMQAYSESEEAGKGEDGKKPRFGMIKDIFRYLEDEEISNRRELVVFSKRYLQEIWSDIIRHNGNVHPTSRAFITFELCVAISIVFHSTDERILFNELMNEYL